MVEPDSDSGRVFFLTGIGSTWTLRAFDIQTLSATGELEIPGVAGTPTSLIRWGRNGLAFRTSGNQVFLIQTSLVPASPAPPIPAPSPTLPLYSLSGRVGEFQGPRLSGATVTFDGLLSTRTTLTDANGMYAFSNIAPCDRATITPTKQYFHVSPASQPFAPGRGFFVGNGHHMLNFFFSAQSRTIDFAQPSITVNEAVGETTITVVRTGDPSEPARVNYETLNSSALQNRDFIFTAGTLRFNAGETTKTFNVLISDDAYVEPNETLLLVLRDPVGTSNTDLHFANLTITDNDTPAPTTNPIDETRFFIRQHYNDFLNRTGDTGGIDFWTARIDECNSLAGDVARCINQRRVDVSAAFFIELEFQRTGYFIYRMHKAAYGNLPLYDSFMADRPRIVEGPGVEASKVAFAEEYVNRSTFLVRYPATLSSAQFVDALNLNSGGSLSQVERDALIAGLNTVPATETRASVLRKVAEDTDFQQIEFDAGFVLMQYFGYLGRNPDPGGYAFWREILRNKAPDDPAKYRDMVCAFITSREYQQRFSPIQTRTDLICASVN